MEPGDFVQHTVTGSWGRIHRITKWGGIVVRYGEGNTGGDFIYTAAELTAAAPHKQLALF